MKKNNSPIKKSFEKAFFLLMLAVCLLVENLYENTVVQIAAVCISYVVAVFGITSFAHDIANRIADRNKRKHIPVYAVFMAADIFLAGIAYWDAEISYPMESLSQGWIPMYIFWMYLLPIMIYLMIADMYVWVYKENKTRKWISAIVCLIAGVTANVMLWADLFDSPECFMWRVTACLILLTMAVFIFIQLRHRGKEIS